MKNSLTATMKYNMKWHQFSEIIIRIFLWSLFIIFDNCDPFIREIREQEAWKYQYPVTISYIPGVYLWILITILPLILFTIEYFITGSVTDQLTATWCLSLAYGLNGILTAFLKAAVGRPRPDFHYRCFPDGKGTDYNHCTGNQKSYLDGRKSFPSGHSSYAFCCMLFIALYTSRKIRRFYKSIEPHSWQICIYFFSFLMAATIAISRTCDYHHHYEDVTAGAIFGSVISYFSFKLYFSKAIKIQEPEE